VLALLLAVPLAIRGVVTPAFVAARASSNLGREVSIGAVGLHFTPLPRIRLEQVTIAPDVTLGAIDVGLRITSLLERKIELDHVLAEDASFTLVRRADGGIELHGATPTEEVSAQGGQGDPDPAGPPALPRLPRIDLRRAKVAFVDHAVADPPLQFSFQVHRLELSPFAAGERPRLSVAAAMGGAGEGGALALDAELGPLEAEASIGEQPVRAHLHLNGLAVAPLLPYFAPHLDVRRLEGALEGGVELEGRLSGELTAELALSLVEGGADLAGVGLSIPRFEGRLERSDGVFEVRKARLESPVVEFGERELRNLRSVFSVADGTFEVESLDFDSHRGSWRTGSGEAGQSETEFEVYVRRTGRVALRGRLSLPSKAGEAAGGGFGVELPEVEIRDAKLEVLTGAGSGMPSTLLRVDRFRLRDFADGEVASYSLEARIGDDGEGGTLSLSGNAGPFVREQSLAELPFSLELTASEVNPVELLPLLPDRWRPSRVEGLFAAEIEIEGPARKGSAEILLTLEDGSLEMAWVELEGRTGLEGQIHRRGDALTVEAGRLTSETLSFADRRAEDLRASFAFVDDTLEIESLDLRAYDGTVHQAGRLMLGEVPRFDFRLEAAGVDVGRFTGMVVEGTEPTLLEGEIAVRGTWNDRPNRLAPIRGDGRFLLHGGMLPSQDLLTSVARSLARLVPGSSRRLRERPRLARLKQATSTFWFEEGRVHTEDLRVHTDDFLATGRGSVGHELDLDFRLDVALTTRGVHKAFALPDFREEYHEAARLPAVPVQVTGSTRSPRFRANASSVPIATLRGLLGLPGRAGAVTRGVAGTARDAADAVGDGIVGGVDRLRGDRQEGQSSPEPLP
jgi:hypothetical protein